MADVSLDEFIRKNNVKVRLNNPQQGPPKWKSQQVKKTARGQNVPTQKPVFKNFDARQKLSPRGITDARDKILVIKKNGGGDARNKIVFNQSQKGTFDARSLLQRQGKKRGVQRNRQGDTGGYKAMPVSAPLSLTRTLANPNAKNSGQIKVTNSGLQVTRPIPNTQIAFSGNSLQITKRTQAPRPGAGGSPVIGTIPIIEIRNDHYREPAGQPPAYLPPSSQSVQHYSPLPVRPQPTYHNDPYEDPLLSYTGQRKYRDLDDPNFNSASIAISDVPRVQISNISRREPAVLARPVTYPGDYPPPPQRAPPGAATLSLAARQPASKPQPIKVSPVGLKRKQAPPEVVSGPLRLGKGGGRGIDLDTSPYKKPKPGPTKEWDVIDVDDGVELISPLQGFRIMVTNLFNGVTQDDIIELFGAVGPLKKAKLLKTGAAEVVYVNREDASSAVQKYHSRELDGQPMYVKMTTPVAAVVKNAQGEVDPDITGEALRLYKKPSAMGSLPEAPIEIPTVHRALFKAGPPGPNKSVKFTVKI